MTRSICIAVLACLAWAAGAAQPARAAPYSSHSQMYSCCTDSPTKEAMFREAKESGAAYIRVDINMPTIFAPVPGAGPRDWAGVDEISRLSLKYQLPVLGILLGSARPAPGCPVAPADTQRLCPPADAEEWGAEAREVAARYAGTIDHLEIWNEPDGRWAFAGQPEDYARMLSAAYRGIKAANPQAQVVLGGTQYPDAQGAAWLDRVFRTPGTDAAWSWDIASIHLRKDARSMVADMWARAKFLQGFGRTAPMWVTEHGYSGDTQYQGDPGFRGGEAAQAAYLAQSLPTLALAGAQQVFVTLRDGGGGQFDSEGIVAGLGGPEPLRRKAAFYAVRSAVDRWPWLAFRSQYVDSRAAARAAIKAGASSARRHAGTVKATVSGRFRGPDCAGRLRLTYRVPRARPVVRTVGVAPDCSYRQTTRLALPRRSVHSRRIRISQRFLGNGQTGPGDSATLSVKLARPRTRGAPRARAAGR